MMNAPKTRKQWEEWMVTMVVDTLMFDFHFYLFAHANNVQRTRDEPEQRFRLTIGAPFDFISSEETRRLDPIHPAELGCLLPLLGRKLTCAKIEKTGHIEIEFETGERIIVDPDDQYEAWNIESLGFNTGFICSPGGGMGVD